MMHLFRQRGTPGFRGRPENMILSLAATGLFLQTLNVGYYVVQIGTGNAGQGLHLALSLSDNCVHIGGAGAERLHFHFHSLGNSWVSLAIGAVTALALRCKIGRASRRERV